MEQPRTRTELRYPSGRRNQILGWTLVSLLLPSSLLSFVTGHEIVGGVLLSLLGLLLWGRFTRYQLVVDEEGIKKVYLGTGKTRVLPWQSISHLRVECRGEDKDDMDFCHHIVFVTEEGKELHTNDHAAVNYLEFARTVQQYLASPELRKELEPVLQRLEEGSKNEST